MIYDDMTFEHLISYSYSFGKSIVKLGFLSCFLYGPLIPEIILATYAMHACMQIEFNKDLKLKYY